MSFKIKPDRIDTDTKTIRFPVKLIKKIDKYIDGKNVTFSGFVIQACEFALENIDDDKDAFEKKDDTLKN